MGDSSSRRVRIIVNPTSGSHGRELFVEHLARTIDARGYQTQVCTTQRPGHATELAAAERESLHAVIACGGDGTVREVAAGLLGSSVALLIAPGGTENLVARHFGYRSDPEALGDALDAWQTRSIDVGFANGRPFLVVAGFGFDADVVAHVTAARNGHITHLDYVLPIWRAFWGHAFRPLHVEADGEPLSDQPGMVFVGNVPRYAIGLPIFVHGDPGDGLLDVCVFQCRGRIRLLRHALRTVLRRHAGSPGVVYRQARSIRVWADQPVSVEMDGDVAGTIGPGSADSGITFTVSAAALHLCLPGAHV